MADEDPKHLARLRSLPCAMYSKSARLLGREELLCDGPVAPHHSTHGRGMGQRSHDHEAFPLCLKHHTEFHLGLGPFMNWTHEHRTEWQKEMVEIYRPKNDPEVF